MISTEVTPSGPFFRRDPGKMLRQNIRDLMEVAADRAADSLRRRISSRQTLMPNWTGWTLDRVVGRVHNLAGQRWGMTAKVQISAHGLDRADAIRTKAAAATIERRWHVIRATRSIILRDLRALRHDLTEGMT